MDIIYNIIVAFCCLILGYIFGSFSPAIAIGKIFYHQDPRNFGSKNAGGTNAGRLWGKKVGFLVIIIDMIKTIAPIWICWAILTFVPFGDKPLMADTVTRLAGADSDYLIRWSVYWLAPFGTVLGHCFPIFLNFKGGKGVSNFMGTAVGTTWLCGFIPGLLYFLILKLKKYVSLASIITPFVIAVFFWTWSILGLTGVTTEISWIAAYGPTLMIDWVASIIVTAMALLVLVRHKGNIERLIQGTERKITWMK